MGRKKSGRKNSPPTKGKSFLVGSPASQRRAAFSSKKNTHKKRSVYYRLTPLQKAGISLTPQQAALGRKKWEYEKKHPPVRPALKLSEKYGIKSVKTVRLKKPLKNVLLRKDIVSGEALTKRETKTSKMRVVKYDHKSVKVKPALRSLSEMRHRQKLPKGVKFADERSKKTLWAKTRKLRERQLKALIKKVSAKTWLSLTKKQRKNYKKKLVQIKRHATKDVKLGKLAQLELHIIFIKVQKNGKVRNKREVYGYSKIHRLSKRNMKLMQQEAFNHALAHCFFSPNMWQLLGHKWIYRFLVNA